MVKSISSSDILKNFGFLTEITILPFFKKLDFLGVSHIHSYFISFFLLVEHLQNIKFRGI